MPPEGAGSGRSRTLAAEVVALLGGMADRYDPANDDPELGPLISAAWARYETLEGEGRAFDECLRTTRIEAVEALFGMRKVAMPT